MDKDLFLSLKYVMTSISAGGLLSSTFGFIRKYNKTIILLDTYAAKCRLFKTCSRNMLSIDYVVSSFTETNLKS